MYICIYIYIYIYIVSLHPVGDMPYCRFGYAGKGRVYGHRGAGDGHIVSLVPCAVG